MCVRKVSDREELDSLHELLGSPLRLRGPAAGQTRFFPLNQKYQKLNRLSEVKILNVKCRPISNVLLHYIPFQAVENYWVQNGGINIIHLIFQFPIFFLLDSLILPRHNVPKIK